MSKKSPNRFPEGNFDAAYVKRPRRKGKSGLGGAASGPAGDQLRSYIDKGENADMAAKKRSNKGSKNKKNKGKKELHGAAKAAHEKAKKRGGPKPKKSKPTEFQKFLMSDPAAAKKKMGWK